MKVYVAFMSLMIPQSSRMQRRHTAVIGLLTFAVYALGACRTVYVGDSGELVTAVQILGIPHPTAYPLYVLLGKLWTLIVPFGSVTFRMSLFSATCAAATCIVLFRICSVLSMTLMARYLSTFMFAFSPSFWSQANLPRVYALNALCLSLATLMAFTWARDKNERCLPWAFFFCGLGAANHTFMAVAAIALGLFVCLLSPNLLWRKPALVLRSGLLCVLGLLPYLYLPLRSRMNPPLDWGNPETLNGFLNVLLRRDFWRRVWMQGPLDLLPIGGDYFHGLAQEFLWIGVTLALVGILAARQRRWMLLFPGLLICLNFLTMALHGCREDLFIWHRYYIPSYFMIALLAGTGLSWLETEMLRGQRTIFAFCLLPALMLFLGWRQFDRSGYRIADDFGRTLLDSLPPNADLCSADDNVLFILMYLHVVEGVRPDVNLIMQGAGESFSPPANLGPTTPPLFLTHHPNWDVPSIEVFPVGLLFQALPAGQVLPPMLVSKTNLTGEDDSKVPKDYLTRTLIGHFHYMLGFSNEQRDWPTARKHFDAAMNSSPDNEYLFFNLAFLFYRNGLMTDASNAAHKALEINPKFTSGPIKAETRDVLAKIEREYRELRLAETSLLQDPRSADLQRNTTDFYLEMARLMDRTKRPRFAHGYRLLAQEAGQSPLPPFVKGGTVLTPLR